jgi:hypothetical protein
MGGEILIPSLLHCISDTTDKVEKSRQSLEGFSLLDISQVVFLIRGLDAYSFEAWARTSSLAALRPPHRRRIRMLGTKAFENRRD